MPGDGESAWPGPLAACWREIAAESAVLARVDEHELLAYAGATLAVVEHALVELLTAASNPRGSERGAPLWCAAQALDVTAHMWHRLRPSAGRRYRALAEQLQERLDRTAAAPPSAGLVAGSARTAGEALERLAVHAGPSQPALDALEDAAVALAAKAVCLWTNACGPSSAAARRAPCLLDRIVAMRRHAEQVVGAADAELGAAPADLEGVGGWLAVAVARRSPMVSLALIDAPCADRVLAAEATRTVNVGWISRGALELLALRSLADESWASRHPRGAPHTVAVARAVRRRAPAVGTSAGRAWRAHSLALARTAATYLRACAENDGGLGQTRQELLDLLADSLVQASRLDAHLTGEDPGGSCALWN